MKLKILLSYHYYKDVDLDALFEKYFVHPYPEVFADSGAYSAMTQGEPIRPADYAAWVKRWGHLFTTYANLDVIGDAAATDRNQRYLEKRGLAPLPVFHTGSDWGALDRLLADYQYIALGGMVPYMRFPGKIMPWLVQCFKRAQGKAVYHGFGATSWRIISNLPWYSVDSSSWGQGFRFGTVNLFDKRVGRFRSVNLGDVPGCRKHARLFASYGFDWLDFADRDRNNRAKLCAVSALSYMRAEQYLRKRHGEIMIPGRDDSPGNRVYLVTAASNPEAERGSNMSINNLSTGLRLYLADARPHTGGDLQNAQLAIQERDRS